MTCLARGQLSKPYFLRHVGGCLKPSLSLAFDAYQKYSISKEGSKLRGELVDATDDALECQDLSSKLR